jgi:hypothetical protein
LIVAEPPAAQRRRVAAARSSRCRGASKPTRDRHDRLFRQIDAAAKVLRLKDRLYIAR